MGGFDGMGWGWGGMGLGPLFVIGLVLVVIVALSYYPRQSNDRDGPKAPLRTPREILDERFAKGEIEREEYTSRRDALIGS
jgi:putative membrane protein